MSKWEDIVNANKLIETTDVKGKAYAEVNQRIKAFRSVHPDGGIETDLLSLENGICTIRAVISNAEGKILGTGIAQEKENSSFINKTSYIENCETSAVGRALGMCGYGIDTSVASYEEVSNAIKNQGERNKTAPSPRDLVLAELQKQGINATEYAKEKGLTKATSDERYTELLRELLGVVEVNNGFSATPPGGRQ